ncbi:ribonuclease H-like domain-containing protein [Tanacetum coccineum]
MLTLLIFATCELFTPDNYYILVDLDLSKLAIGLQKANQIQDLDLQVHEDASDNGTATNKLKQQQQQLTPTTTTISNIKLPILKKEEYDIWAMEMEHYLEYIDNDVWKVIQNGNSKKRISTGKDGVVRILPPVSAAEIHAVEKERKARTILLMAIPKEHLRRFHGMDDAKEIWEAIRTKHFLYPVQQLLIIVEAHGAEVSTWGMQITKFLDLCPHLAWYIWKEMTMRTKPDVDTLSIGDLYNNLRVFEQELTSTSKSSAMCQMLLFVSTQQEASTNSEGSFGNPSKHSSESESESISVPNEMSASKSVTTNEKDHPLKNMEDRGIFDSGCSGHMTGNKDHLDDFEECKGGSVTFGGSKGYITGKGRIRVGNLDFDSVSFVKNLGIGIKQEYSNARTPQQNGVAKRMNRTLIEAARTMLADSLLPTTFWAEAVSTACYIFNRVEVNLHVKFLEEKPNVKGVGTLQTPNANASEEADEDEELIVVPIAIKHSAAKVDQGSLLLIQRKRSF